MEKMSRYLAENLTMIRHTSVVTEITADFSELPEPEMEEISGTVSSVRLDSVIALAGRLSGRGQHHISKTRRSLSTWGCLHECIAESSGRRDLIDPRHRQNSGLASQAKSYEKGADICRGVPP